MTPRRTRVPTDARWAETVGYSRALRVDSTVRVSGTVAVRPDGSVGPEGDAYAQTLGCLKIIVDALEQAGARAEDVVSTRIYVTDVSRWEEVGRAHGEYFADVKPATAMVEVAGLIVPEALVEIEAVAVVGLTD